jgi:transposase
MGAPYSEDLRIRVIRAVEAGSSARAAGRVFAVSPSTAVKWVHRWRQTGSVAALPMGGSFSSPLDTKAEELLELIADEPDLTIEEFRLRLGERGISTSHGSVWRFFDRHGLTFKKKRCMPPSKTEPT